MDLLVVDGNCTCFLFSKFYIITDNSSEVKSCLKNLIRILFSSSC